MARHAHRRRPALALTLALAALLAPAGAASAKGLAGLMVCGADRCVDRTAVVRDDHALGMALTEYGVTVADPGPASFFRLEEQTGDGGQGVGVTTVAYVPRWRVLRFSDGTFHRTSPQLRARLRELTRGVQPLPASASFLTAAQERARRAAAAAPDPDVLALAATARRQAAAEDGDDLPVLALLLAAGAAAAGAVLLAARHRRRTGRPATG